MISDSAEIGPLSRTVEDTGGVYLVPAFTGLGAPHWDMYARGCVMGLTRGTTRAHLARAAEESIAYQVAELVGAMERDTGVALKTLNADGGASRDGFLMQFQADILGRPVRRPAILETTALGAALLAGLAVGVWDSTEQIRRGREQGALFSPEMPPQQRERLLAGWSRAVGHSRGWAGPQA